MKKNRKKLLTACMIAAVSIASLSTGMLSEKKANAETETVKSGQYECDAQGNKVDAEAGTSRYYVDYVTLADTVYISNSTKVQMIPVELKYPYTDLEFIAFDALKGVDEDGYRTLSNCNLSLIGPDKHTVQESNYDTLKEDQIYKYSNLTPGIYQIVVIRGVNSIITSDDDEYQEAVEGPQYVEYTMRGVVDRQAAAVTPEPSAAPNTTASSQPAPTDKADKQTSSSAKKHLQPRKTTLKKYL